MQETNVYTDRCWDRIWPNHLGESFYYFKDCSRMVFHRYGLNMRNELKKRTTRIDRCTTLQSKHICKIAACFDTHETAGCRRKQSMTEQLAFGLALYNCISLIKSRLYWQKYSTRTHGRAGTSPDAWCLSSSAPTKPTKLQILIVFGPPSKSKMSQNHRNKRSWSSKTGTTKHHPRLPGHLCDGENLLYHKRTYDCWDWQWTMNRWSFGCWSRMTQIHRLVIMNQIGSETAKGFSLA